MGIAAVETERQRETIPKIVRDVSYRIIFYYVGVVVVLGLNVSANDPILAADLSNCRLSYMSHFVLMVRRAGLSESFAGIINAMALLVAISVANVNLYSGVSDPSLRN